jgi:hypothetical protein
MLPHDVPQDNPPGAPCPPVPDVPQPALLFSRPCPRCQASVSLPWCGLASALLDQMTALEAHLEDLRIEASVAHARLARLEALQGQAEAQP